MNPDSSAPITLFNKRRMRMERAKGISHVVPAFVLLGSLLGVISGREAFTWLTGLEVLVGAAYIGLLARELLHLRRHGLTHVERIAWLELAAAGILALEGYHIWHRHHEEALLTGVHEFHLLPWLYFGVALWYLFMAFNIKRFYDRRFLHLHPAGFSGRLHPFSKRFSFSWADIARLEPQGDTDVLVHHANGQQQKLSFKSIHEGAAYRDQLLAHARQGLQE